MTIRSGAACPFGAHMRRANPRNADYPGHPTGLARLVATLGLGREAISRRPDVVGAVSPHSAPRARIRSGLSRRSSARQPAPPDDPERGLHFICLNANISRQFEFLQNAWMMSSKFSGLTGESDPLLGTARRCPVAR